MDAEAGKDDLSVEDANLVVFEDIEYTVVDSFQRSCWSKRTEKHAGQTILTGACGSLRPGRLTFILGPSGAGKSTLMNILAGRKRTGVHGCLLGVGRNVVLVAQHAELIDSLTTKETLEFAASLKLPNATKRERHHAVRKYAIPLLVAQHAELIDALTTKETLEFAASLKLPNATKRERNHAIESVAQQLGIFEVLSTKAGSLSGGERKRLTIACELLTDPTILLLDEPTSGLDSVSSMSVARALRTVAAGGRTVACVVHQPSSRLFSSADDVILLANGRTFYAGPVADVPAALARAGFSCPQYYNMADYLLEVATFEHTGNLDLLEREAKSYAFEMKKIARNEVQDNRGQDVSTDAEALLSSNLTVKREYAASVTQQLSSLLWRGCIGALRDVHLTQIRLIAHILVALLLGALYTGAGADGARVTTNTGCLFFFLLFLFFSNAMPTIHTFPVEATVVLQEHLNRWYWLTTYCFSKIIVDLPIQLLCATVFVFPAWYLTSQPLDVHRMALAWVICVLITILAQTFGLVVGAACGVKLGLFVIPAANIPMLMFSEFFISYNEMPVYLQPFAKISYFRYAFDAFLEAVYGFNRQTLPCKKSFCMFKKPELYLDYLGLSRDYVADIWALAIWIWLLQISLVCVLAFRVYRACR